MPIDLPVAAAAPDIFNPIAADPDDIGALLRLVACGGAAAPRRRLLERCPRPAAALAAGASLWRGCGLSQTQVAALLAPAPAGLAQARAWLERPGHRLLGW